MKTTKMLVLIGALAVGAAICCASRRQMTLIVGKRTAGLIAVCITWATSELLADVK